MRKQSELEDLGPRWSDEAATVCPPEEDRTRQEFKEEADINVILRRAGAGGFEARPVSYGVQDLDLDLQGVYAAVEVAQEAWERLPGRLRKRYPSWAELLPALERGEAALVDPDGVVVDPPGKEPKVPEAVS